MASIPLLMGSVMGTAETVTVAVVDNLRSLNNRVSVTLQASAGEL